MTTGIVVSDCSSVDSCDASGAMLLTMLLLRFDRSLLLVVGCRRSQSFAWHIAFAQNIMA